VVNWCIEQIDIFVLSPPPQGLLCQGGIMHRLVCLAVDAIPPLSPIEKRFMKPVCWKIGALAFEWP
jgi:hypothetical protein